MIRVWTVTPEPKPTVDVVGPLVTALYSRPGGGAGCCLHVVLDDGNVEDCFVWDCIVKARAVGHADCEELAQLMARMSKTQRRRLCARKGSFYRGQR